MTDAKNTSAAIERARARSEAIQDERRRLDALYVEYGRKYFGHVESLDPVFDVPLAYGGPAALLIRADLTTRKGALAYLRRYGPRGSKPTFRQYIPLRRLRLAQELLRAVDLLLTNNAPRLWPALRLAHGAFYSKTDSYLRLLEIVDGVRGLLERTERYYRSPHTLPRSRTEVFSESVFRFRAAQRELIALDPRFAALTLKHLRSIEPTRAPTRKGKGKRPSAHADAVRIAVTLCRLTGAFDAGDKTYGDVKRWFAHALAATPERRDARSKRNKSGRSKISR